MLLIVQCNFLTVLSFQDYVNCNVHMKNAKNTGTCNFPHHSMVDCCIAIVYLWVVWGFAVLATRKMEHKKMDIKYEFVFLRIVEVFEMN